MKIFKFDSTRLTKSKARVVARTQVGRKEFIQTAYVFWCREMNLCKILQQTDISMESFKFDPTRLTKSSGPVAAQEKVGRKELIQTAYVFWY